MNNKKIGGLLIIFCILLFLLVLSFNHQLNKAAEISCSCGEGTCPHEQQTPNLIYFGIILITALAALGVYLLFFEKTQQRIFDALDQHHKTQTKEEKFNILLKGLTNDEKKVIKSIKEQGGITQQTLRIRTGMHKSKLSIIITNLEKKGLITKTPKGKTNKIHLKIKL